MHHLLYHQNCADGFAAVTLARHALQSLRGIPAADIRLQPVNYGWAQQRPAAEDLYAGDHVYYLDYTPPAAVIAQLRQEWGDSLDLTIIDHHSTAAPLHGISLERSADTPVRPASLDEGRAFEAPHSPPAPALAFTSVFDLTHSGAALTWKHFHPTAPSFPSALALIEHRDLGHAWQRPGASLSTPSLNFHAYLMRCLPRTPEAWLPVLIGLRTDYLSRCGSALRLIDTHVLAAAAAQPHWLDFGAAYGERIPAVNGLGAELISDACQALLEAWPTAPFAASWWIDPKTGHATYSLRSRKGQTNVALIAAMMAPGGGGHPNAAGFNTPVPVPFSKAS